MTLKPPAKRGMSPPTRSSRGCGQATQQYRGRAAVPAGRRSRSAPAAGRAFASYQYTIQADSLDELNAWVPKITAALQDVPELDDVNSDQQDKGLEVDLKLDRPTASRLGLTTSQIDNTLYDAFGQRQVSTIYKDKNQYHVVMEVAPAFWQSPETLRDIYVSTSAGTVSGTQSTNAVAGTVAVAGEPATAAPGGTASVSSTAANTVRPTTAPWAPRPTTSASAAPDAATIRRKPPKTSSSTP